MKANGCEFPDSFESEDIDFDTVDACNVSLQSINYKTAEKPCVM